MTSATAASVSVLADPTRARILEIIRAAPDGRARVGLLADRLGLRQPTISHHMAVLHAEGVVERTKVGRVVWYRIHPAQRERIDALIGDAPAADDPDWDRVVDDLADRFRGEFERAEVSRCVRESRDALAARGDAPFLASRTAAFAASRLDDLVRSRGTVADPTVLFVCVQNAGRSQLAAGILRHLAGDRVVVRTAGSAPAATLRPVIATVLDEIGVSVGGEFPKPLTDDAVRAADFVITMGCGDACPVYPGRTYLDWDLDDPVDQPIEVVRRIRDDIHSRVRDLMPRLRAWSPAANA